MGGSVIPLVMVAMVPIIGGAIGKRSGTTGFDYPDYASKYDEYPVVVPKRAALLLDQLMVALQKVVDNQNGGEIGSGRSQARSSGSSHLPVASSQIVPSADEQTVHSELCDGGHVCSPPKECCSFDCCYSVFPQVQSHISDMFNFLIWTYWYLWAAVLAGLAVAAACGCWLWRRRRSALSEDCSSSDRASSGPWFPPPHYSRCSSFVQTLPPPYNEVTAKPDLYPLVIGYDESSGKGTSGFVMRYFRSLSHASTLDSLSSSFMCNVVNEANTIIPPPYSYNESVDEISSAVGCERAENGDVGSVVSLANHRTASDISSLAAQSPCSPPRATSPTIELRELLDKIQQLPQLPSGHTTVLPCHQGRPQALYAVNANGSVQQRPLSPGDVASYKASNRRTRGKMYMPLGLPNSRSKAKRWLSRSAPATPSGTIPMAFLPGQSRRPSESDNNNQQVVPLLAEQDENEANNISHTLPEHEEDRQET